jgi:hypothetical protein
VKVKVIPKEEYDRLVKESEESIISELFTIFYENKIVAIEYPDEQYKILKYPGEPQTGHWAEDLEHMKLGIVVSKEELQKYIFLYAL